jgi:DNA polymerase III epsilon subunit-like protein
MVTFMSEYSIPICTLVAQGDSLTRPETKMAIEDMHAAWDEMGFNGPRFCTVDNYFQTHICVKDAFTTVKAYQERRKLEEEAARAAAATGAPVPAPAPAPPPCPVAPTVAFQDDFQDAFQDEETPPTEKDARDGLPAQRRLEQLVANAQATTQAAQQSGYDFTKDPASAYSVAMNQIRTFASDPSADITILRGLPHAQRKSVYEVLEKDFADYIQHQTSGADCSRFVELQKLRTQSTRIQAIPISSRPSCPRTLPPAAGASAAAEFLAPRRLPAKERPAVDIFIDFETTGVATTGREASDIIEIGAITADKPAFQSFVSSGKAIPDIPGQDAAHRITRQEVDSADSFKDVFPKLLQYIDDARDGGPVRLIAHNGFRFDFPLLFNQMRRENIDLGVLVDKQVEFGDTLQATREAFPRGKGQVVQNYKLPTVFKYITGNDLDGAHRAVADAQAAQKVWNDPRVIACAHCQTICDLDMVAKYGTRELRFAAEQRERLLDEFMRKINPDWKCESVREDPWHFMNHLNAMSRHKQTPMYKLFMTMVSQAMFKFVESSDDPKVASRNAVRKHLKKLYGKHMNDAEFADFLRHVPYAYWVSRCRRVMPAPEIMLRDVIDVYQAFINLDDPDTKSCTFPEGEPFYKRNHEEILRLQLKYICKGCLSDPPDFCFYQHMGEFATTGLEKFKCIRGTNDLEGFHTDMQVRRRSLASASLCSSLLLSLLLAPACRARACLFHQSTPCRRCRTLDAR